MNWLVEQLIRFIERFTEGLSTDFANLVESYIESLLSPIVGVPAPRNGDTWLVFDTATNPPWTALLAEIYWELVIPLALGLQFVSLAYLGLRYSSLPHGRRVKSLARLLLAFLSLFFWLPVASAAGLFFDAIGHAILTEGIGRSDIITWFTSAAVPGGHGYNGLTLLLMLVMVYIFFKSIFIFVGRYIGIILITLLMPLIATFWSVTIWPLNQFDDLARQAASSYVALLVAGIPPAFLFRIGADVGFALPNQYSWVVFTVTLWGAAKAQKWIMTHGAPKLVELSNEARAHAAKPVKGAGDAAWSAATIGGYAAAGGLGGGAVSAARSAVGSGRTPYGVHQVHRQLSKTRADRGSSSSGFPKGGRTKAADRSRRNAVQNAKTRINSDSVRTKATQAVTQDSDGHHVTSTENTRVYDDDASQQSRVTADEYLSNPPTNPDQPLKTDGSATKQTSEKGTGDGGYDKLAALFNDDRSLESLDWSSQTSETENHPEERSADNDTQNEENQ